MKDENGNEMSEETILHEAIELMSDVCCLLFETKTAEGIASAYMADSLIKYLQVILNGDDVLLAASDFSRYEEKLNKDVEL